MEGTSNTLISHLQQDCKSLTNILSLSQTHI